jgi:predicted transcriptional regulator
MRLLSIKETTLKVVKSLPETCSLEDVMYQINLAAQTLEGLTDIKEGRTTTTKELLNKVSKWKAE